MKQSENQEYFTILLLLEIFSSSDLGHLTTDNIIKTGINLERMLRLIQGDG